MTINHISINHRLYGSIPLCGRADWNVLTDEPSDSDCSECRWIAGIEAFAAVSAEAHRVDAPPVAVDPFAARLVPSGIAGTPTSNRLDVHPQEVTQ